MKEASREANLLSIVRIERLFTWYFPASRLNLNHGRISRTHCQFLGNHITSHTLDHEPYPLQVAV